MNGCLPNNNAVRASHAKAALNECEIAQNACVHYAYENDRHYMR